jgi:hypothetical protein
MDAVQLAFDGTAHTPPPTITQQGIKDRVRAVLARHPDARNNYRRLMFYYWLEYDGLADILPDELREAFKLWIGKRATAPKTLQNRCMEVQNEYPELEASSSVQEWRERQSRAGAVL